MCCGTKHSCSAFAKDDASSWLWKCARVLTLNVKLLFLFFLFFGVCFLAGQCEVMWRGGGGGICEEKESKKGNRCLKGFVRGC